MPFQVLSNIIVLSYAAAVLAFLLLGALLFARCKTQPYRMPLVLACLLTAGWAGVLALQSDWNSRWGLPAAIMEVLRDAGWSLFLLMMMGFFQRARRPAAIRINPFIALIGLFYLAALAVAIVVYREAGYPTSAAAYQTVILFRMGCAVLGLLLVEQLYRNTRAEHRWGIKFACLGIGGLFAYDFYLYSDAMLFRHVSPEIWAARGAVNVLTAPLIAISAWRKTKWSLGIKVSRHILFHSAALFGAAAYLLIMASAGYYVRIFGGTWGSVMQLAFLFGAVVLLVGVLFSGTFRSRLRVFISKHFYSYNYDYREEWLGFTRSLSEKGPGLETRVIQALAKLVESPGGALFIVGAAGQCEAAAHWNMALAAEFDPGNPALCQFLARKQWVIDFQEYRADPARYDQLIIPPWLRDFPRVRLVIPLTLHGKLLGFVVLAEPRSALKLNWEIIDLLKIAGSQAAGYLAQQQSANDLMVARQFESFNRMSTFVVHDLKNLVSQLSLLMSNADRHKDNPEFQRDMSDTIGHSVQKMKLILQKLGRKDSFGTLAPLRLDDILRQAVDSKSAIEPRPVLAIADAGLTVMANLERLERVIGHIIQNAIEASSRGGEVVVGMRREGERVMISISDNGQGMSEQFIRERLFKPFESTKSAGMGIGVFESREYIHELGGELTVVSREAVGTVFCIMLPLHHVAPVRAQLQEETSEPK